VSLRQMQFRKVRLQIQPHRLPVLRRRFHHHFGDAMFPQPADNMLSFSGPGSEAAALKLDGFTCRVRYLVTGDCHHYHQNFLVYVDACYRVRHNVLSGEEAAERAIDNDYAPLRAHGPSSTDGSCHIH
jgi:hypothetical protein